MKFKNRKKWLLNATHNIDQLKYVKKPEAKALFKLEETFRKKLFDLLKEINAYDKISELLPFLHSMPIQEINDQLRLYADFWKPDHEGVLIETKISIGTVGLRMDKKDREKQTAKFHEIKATFTALRHVSQAIEALN